MAKSVSLRDANQAFARYIRQVEGGEEYVITRNGTPVARLTPVTERGLSPAQQAALARTHARMNQGWHLDAEPVDRDALHER